MNEGKRAADDVDTIHARIQELKREAADAQRCRCVQDGKPYCPVHAQQYGNSSEYMGCYNFDWSAVPAQPNPWQGPSWKTWMAEAPMTVQEARLLVNPALEGWYRGLCGPYYEQRVAAARDVLRKTWIVARGKVPAWMP